MLGQSYPNIEYIVIDGGSTDGSVEMIDSTRTGWRIGFQSRTTARPNAINKGFARANGEILAWLNSDDTYQPEAVAEAVAYLQEHPEVGLVYGETNFIDEHGQCDRAFPGCPDRLAPAAARVCAYPAAGRILAGRVVAAGRSAG